MNKTLVVGFLFVAAFTVVPRASANIIGPGMSGSPDTFLTSSITGPVLASTTGNYAEKNASNHTVGTGHYTLQVIQDTSRSDELDFLFQFTVLTGQIDNVSASAFGNYTTDVGYLTPSIGSNPSQVERTSDGNVVNWTFGSAVTMGQTTATLAILTNATAFTSGFVSIIDSGTANEFGYQPVPDGGTTVMLLGGVLIGITTLRRKFVL